MSADGCLTMVFCGDHFATYTNIQSLMQCYMSTIVSLKNSFKKHCRVQRISKEVKKHIHLILGLHWPRDSIQVYLVYLRLGNSMLEEKKIKPGNTKEGQVSHCTPLESELELMCGRYWETV